MALVLSFCDRLFNRKFSCIFSNLLFKDQRQIKNYWACEAATKWNVTRNTVIHIINHFCQKFRKVSYPSSSPLYVTLYKLGAYYVYSLIYFVYFGYMLAFFWSCFNPRNYSIFLIKRVLLKKIFFWGGNQSQAECFDFQ